MRRNAVFFLFVGITLFALLTGIHYVTARAKASTPPAPDYIAPEINASPTGQTVFSPSYKGVWTVSVSGSGSNMCIQVHWGDACGSATSCGYHDGDSPHYSHRFTCSPGTYFSQSWKLYNTLGGPVYDHTHVYVYP